RLALWHVIAAATIEGKSDGTQPSHIRNGQDALHLGRCSRRRDPVGLAGPPLNERLLWVWYGIGLTDMIDDPLAWNLITAKRLTQPYLPPKSVLWLIQAAATIQSKSDGTRTS